GIIFSAFHAITNFETLIISAFQHSFREHIERHVFHFARNFCFHKSADAFFKLARKPIMSFHGVMDHVSKKTAQDKKSCHDPREHQDNCVACVVWCIHALLLSAPLVRLLSVFKTKLNNNFLCCLTIMSRAEISTCWISTARQFLSQETASRHLNQRQHIFLMRKLHFLFIKNVLKNRASPLVTEI